MAFGNSNYLFGLSLQINRLVSIRLTNTTLKPIFLSKTIQIIVLHFAEYLTIVAIINNYNIQLKHIVVRCCIKSSTKYVLNSTYLTFFIIIICVISSTR